MDNQLFMHKYGYAPDYEFKKGPRIAAIIISIIAAVLWAVVIVLDNVVSLEIYHQSFFSPLQCIPPVCAILTLIFVSISRPDFKILLPIPFTLWLAYSIYNTVMGYINYFSLGYDFLETLEIMNGSLSLHSIIITILLWLCCTGAIKNANGPGIYMVISVVLSFGLTLLNTLVSLFTLFSGFYYEYQFAMTLINFADMFAMLLFNLTTGLIFFMIGNTRYTQGYIPTAWQTPIETTATPVDPANAPPVAVPEESAHSVLDSSTRLPLSSSFAPSCSDEQVAAQPFCSLDPPQAALANGSAAQRPASLDLPQAALGGSPQPADPTPSTDPTSVAAGAAAPFASSIASALANEPSPAPSAVAPTPTVSPAPAAPEQPINIPYEPILKEEKVEEAVKVSPKFCTNCGAQLTENAKFCNNCGTAVQNV